VAGGTPGEQGAVEILSWPDAERLQLVTEHTDVAWSVAWRGDSQAWASASADRTLRIHTENGRCLQALAGHSRGATGVAWLPNNQTLVSTSLDQSVRVWNADQPAAIRTLENHTRGVLALAMMPGATTNDAARIATVGDDRTVRIWQPSIGRMVRFSRLESPPKALAWTPDGGKVVAACADGRVRTIDANLAQVVADVAAVEGWAYSVAIAADGESVAVGGERGQVVQVTTNGLR
jgi:WD40 repeat protein